MLDWGNLVIVRQRIARTANGRAWKNVCRREATDLNAIISRYLTFALSLCWLIVTVPTAIADQGDDQYALASSHYRNARWQLAIEEFQQLINNHPEHRTVPLAHFFLGELNIQTEQYESSIDHFDYFIDRVAEHPLRLRALFRTAEARYLIGQDDQAIQQLEQLIKQGKTPEYDQFSLVYLGEMYQRRAANGDLKKARTVFQKALSQYPDSTLANRCRLGLAQILQAEGNHQEANRYLTFLMESGDPEVQAEVVVSRAALLVDMGQWAEAETLLNPSALEKLRGLPQAKGYYWLGRAQLGAEQWESAAGNLKIAYTGLGSDLLAEAAAYDLSVAYWRQGNTELADEMLRTSLERWPAGRWAAEARYLRIQAALQMGDFTEVPSLVREFSSFHPEHPLWTRVLEAEGRAAFSREDYQQARTSFESLIQMAAQWSLNDPDQAQQLQLLPSWHYMLGVSQLAAGDYSESVRSCDQCLKLMQGGPANPLQASVGFAKSTALMKSERFAEALEVQRQWLEDFPASQLKATVKSDQLRAMVAMQQWGPAKDLLPWIETILPTSGTSPSPELTTSVANSCLKIARYHYDHNQIDDARKWFQLAERSTDAKVQQQAVSGLAWTEFRTATGEDQEKAFQLLISRYPNSELTANATLYHAEQLVDRGKISEARQQLRELLDRQKQWPNRHLALALLAKLTVAQGSQSSKRSAAGYLEEAIQRLEEAVEPADCLDAYRYDLAWLQMDLGQNVQAISTFRQIHLNHPDSRYWADATFRIAQYDFDRGNQQAAKQILERLLERHEKWEPESTELVTDELLVHVYYLRAMIAVKDGQWSEVESFCRRISQEYPGHGLRWNCEYWQAEAHYRRSEFQAASAALQLVVERTAGQKDSWVAMSHLRLAQSLGQQEQWEEALEVAKNAQRLFPDFRQGYELDYLMGRALAQDARFEEARAAYQRVVDSEVASRTETAAMAQWMIGESYFHQQQYVLAARAYHRTETLYRFPQWQAASLLQAGKCYEHMSRDTEAISAYRQLIREHAGHPLAQQGQQRMQRLIDKQNLTATGSRNRLR